MKGYKCDMCGEFVPRSDTPYSEFSYIVEEATLHDPSKQVEIELCQSCGEETWKKIRSGVVEE